MNKTKLKRIYKKYFSNDCIFDIELYKRDNEKALFLHNDLNIELDIVYKNNEEKQEIYELLNELLNKFDFSFTLEFNTLEELREFVSI